MCTPTRKRKAYSIEDKLSAIYRVRKKGESQAKVSRDISVAESTLRGWLKEENKLKSFMSVFEKSGGLKRKRSKIITPKIDNMVDTNHQCQNFKEDILPLEGLSDLDLGPTYDAPSSKKEGLSDRELGPKYDAPRKDAPKLAGNSKIEIITHHQNHDNFTAPTTLCDPARCKYVLHCHPHPKFEKKAIHHWNDADSTEYDTASDDDTEVITAEKCLQCLEVVKQYFEQNHAVPHIFLMISSIKKAIQISQRKELESFQQQSQRQAKITNFFLKK